MSWQAIRREMEKRIESEKRLMLDLDAKFNRERLARNAGIINTENP